jgi:hypothetical protein
MEIKINCFISYSHNDNELKASFENHLAEFFKEIDINVWSDSNLIPGQNWYYSIDKRLEESNIIFCLISNNFVKSTPCNDELNRAMVRYRNGTSIVIPVMLNSEELNPQDLVCRDLHFCPVLEGRIKPISDWPSPKDGFRTACLQVKVIVEDLLKQLKNKDRDWRFREIQNMVAMSKIGDAMKEMLGFSREFCGDNMLMQNKVCISMGLYSNLEKQLKENPGDIIDKVMNLLKVMDELYKECGCKPSDVN